MKVSDVILSIACAALAFTMAATFDLKDEVKLLKQSPPVKLRVDTLETSMVNNDSIIISILNDHHKAIQRQLNWDFTIDSTLTKKLFAEPKIEE